MEKWEKKLSPRVRERLAQIKITSEDRERIKRIETLKFFLSLFYQGKLSPDDLGEELKKYQVGKREFFVKEIQLKLIDSLSFQIASPNFKRRGKCILILEKVKTDKKHSLLKNEINLLGGLIKKYLDGKNKVYEQLKKEIENEPRLRMRQVQTEQGEVVIHLSTDEAVLASSKWREFIPRHEVTYTSQFSESIKKLKEIVT